MRRLCRPIPGFVGLWLLALMSAWGAFTVGATSVVGADASPDAFVSRFVAAINSKESAQITALIDSRSLKCLSGEAAELLSFTIANWIKAPISAQYKAQIDDLGPEAPLLMDAFMPGRFVYPARPTRKVQISAEVTASSGRLIIAEIGLDAGEWKVDLACPKEGTMAWMKRAREEGIEQGKVVDALIASLSPDHRNELVSMAKSGHWIDAAHKIEKDHQVELTIAVLAMRKLSPLK
jgi:hypothetical protein